MKLYLSGPMRSKPLFNFPAFEAARTKLRELGHEVRCPAENDINKGFDPAKGSLEGFDILAAFTWDFEAIKWCDGIVLLEGWPDSKGSTAELAMARALGKTVFEYLDAPNRDLLQGSFASVKGIAGGLEAPDDAFVIKGDERLTSPTGGQKGIKLARFDLIPPGPLKALAEVFGFGTTKYAEHNWRKGYPWGLSSGALQRHVIEWLMGSDADDESGLHPLAHAAWHCMVLMELEDIWPEYDDRMHGARVLGESPENVLPKTKEELA
jgi:hypothetical protein